jgi:hypothetical protein
MLLHLNFYIERFDSNSKADSKSFRKCYEKKKKRKIFLFSAFGPAQPSSPPLACVRFPRVRPVLLSLRVPLWAEPSERRWNSSRAHRLPLSAVTDTPGPRVRRAPFLKPTPSSLSLFTTDRIRHPYPFLPCLEHHRAIKAECRTPPLYIAPKQGTDIVPRRPCASRSPSRPPLRAA